jgi:ankyrin repeat protein
MGARRLYSRGSDSNCAGYRDVVQILLDAGADAETRDRDGKSVLLWAMIKNEPIIAEALIRNGANVDVVNKEGSSTYSNEYGLFILSICRSTLTNHVGGL